nr:MAG TPA: hypothetical protein [Caudoviricetes sp.]
MHDYATHDGLCRRREYSTWALLISSLTLWNTAISSSSPTI